MKARQMGGACAVAIALLTTGAITGSGAAMADDRPTPSRVTVCGTGPVYRSAHVRIEIKCDIRVDFERRRRMQDNADNADNANDALLPESLDAVADQ
ncbi:hypothetical protein [Nonomuraea sp. NPDC002799]